MPRFIFAVAALALCACSPRVQVTNLNSEITPRDPSCGAPVYREHDKIDPSMEEIGDVHVGDTGFTVDCSTPRMLEELSRQACLHGADAAVVRRIQPPGLWSTCARIDATLLRARSKTIASGGPQ